ncbi:hypothetical protein EON62_00480 [archaeon]|nr:MAG: hypothetical protein EON62_00480 [archaeon]
MRRYASTAREARASSSRTRARSLHIPAWRLREGGEAGVPPVPGWGLTPRFARALAPSFVLSLHAGVTQGILSAPHWSGAMSSAAAVSFLESRVTPRDAYILDLMLRATLGEHAAPTGERQGRADASTRVKNVLQPLAGGGAPPAGHAGNANQALESLHMMTFLEAATDVFTSLFTAGVPSVHPTAPTLDDENTLALLHEELVQKLKEVRPSAVLPRVRIARVHHAALVDFHALWDTREPGSDGQLQPVSDAAVSERGHSVTVDTKNPSAGFMSKLSHSFMHYFGLRTAQRITARATVAFVCEEEHNGQAVGTPVGAALPPAAKSPTAAASASAAAAAASAAAAGVHAPLPVDLNATFVSMIPAHWPGLTVLPLMPRLAPQLGAAPATVDAAAPPVGDAPAPAARYTVHTVTFEAGAESYSAWRNIPLLRSMMPSRLEATGGWRVVDVDGHWSDAWITDREDYTYALRRARGRVSQDRLERSPVEWLERELLTATSASAQRIAAAVGEVQDLLLADADFLPLMNERGRTFAEPAGAAHVVDALRVLLEFVAGMTAEGSSLTTANPWATRVELATALETAVGEALAHGEASVQASSALARARELAAAASPPPRPVRVLTQRFQALLASAPHVVTPDATAVASAFVLDSQPNWSPVMEAIHCLAEDAAADSLALSLQMSSLESFRVSLGTPDHVFMLLETLVPHSFTAVLHAGDKLLASYLSLHPTPSSPQLDGLAQSLNEAKTTANTYFNDMPHWTTRAQTEFKRAVANLPPDLMADMEQKMHADMRARTASMEEAANAATRYLSALVQALTFIAKSPRLAPPAAPPAVGSGSGSGSNAAAKDEHAQTAALPARRGRARSAGRSR